MKSLLMSVDVTEGRVNYEQSDWKPGHWPSIVNAVFPVITCTFGSFILIIINHYYVFSICLVGYVYVLIIWNIFCLINHVNDCFRERETEPPDMASTHNSQIPLLVTLQNVLIEYVFQTTVSQKESGLCNTVGLLVQMLALTSLKFQGKWIINVSCINQHLKPFTWEKLKTRSQESELVVLH